MDLGFHTRRGGPAAPAGALDFRTVVATLAATQARGRTARMAALIGTAPAAMLSRDAALAVLFLAHAGWLRAAADLDGSFDATLAAAFRAPVVKDTDHALYPPV